MTVLVLGGGGMAGHVIALYLREQGLSVDTLSANHKLDQNTHLLDVTDTPALLNFLDNHQYDIVINCIGLLVKPSEEHKDLAVYLNSYLPHLLESHYRDTQTRVIHLSTDSIFSGKHAPYTEDSVPDGEQFYDRTKALGELANAKDLTLRMSIVGPELNPSGTGLFNWFWQQSGDISGYSKVIWNGITTVQLAKGIHASIEQNITGLYHLVPDDSISKYNLLRLFKDAFNRDDIAISANEDNAKDKTLVNNRSDFDFTLPNYPSMISEMKKWIALHPSLYPHYRQ